jgi:hypothetical protein
MLDQLCVYVSLCLYICIICVCVCVRVSFLPRFSLVCCFMVRKSLPFRCGFLFELLHSFWRL